MASVNKVILIGNLGADPEMRYMPNGDGVCNFSIATSESWKDKATGEKKEVTEWHRITTYRKLAEICGEHLKKGASVYVEGKLHTRKWQDKEGVDRYTTEVIADNMRMLGGRPDSERTSGDQTDGQKARRAPADQSKPQGAERSRKAPSSFEDMDDDIPF